jgi:hypothetical protein
MFNQAYAPYATQHMQEQPMDLYVAAGFLGVVAVIAYRYGSKAGQRRAVLHARHALEYAVADGLLRPWLKQFEAKYMRERSWDVNADTLSECLQMAQRLYAIRHVLPGDGFFELPDQLSVRSIVSGHIVHIATPWPDGYMGQPTGYIDAFVTLLESSKGSPPASIWLNTSTGDITDHPLEGERYERIDLRSLGNEGSRPLSSGSERAR